MRNLLTGWLGIVLMGIVSTCGSAKNVAEIIIEGETYVSVTAYGATVNDRTDDTRMIQAAINQEEKIYFPPGQYYLNTATNGALHNPYMLLISEQQRARQLHFSPGAELVINGEINLPSNTFIILKIFADEGDIERVSITGLKISGKNINPDKSFTGLKAIEHKGNQIKELIIDDAEINDLTGGGLFTYASRNYFTNIRTRNLGSHGIGARNPYNLDDPSHELHIDGYVSVGNHAYSIDFSGSQIGNDASTADPRDHWIGTARNIRSVGAKRGIKTAGHWDLLLENVEIIDPEIYGFFINKDAPDCSIQMRNVLIEGSGDAAMSLSGHTHLEAENLRIMRCAEAVRAKNTSMNIKGLLFDGQGVSQSGLRLSTNCVIEDFTIMGVQDDYVIWIIRGDVRLNNGHIYGNECRYPVLVHENAGQVELNSLNFSSPDEEGIQNRETSYPKILSLQKEEALILRSMNKDLVSRQ